MLPAYSIEADVESGDIEAIPQNETLFQDEMKSQKTLKSLQDIAGANSQKDLHVPNEAFK